MEATAMAAVTTPDQVSGQVGERIDVPPLTLLLLGIVLFGAYVMLQENGLLLNNWTTVHEFFHDGRHALGFPCH
jgi:translation initiation factor 6 (eIF-6)